MKDKLDIKLKIAGIVLSLSIIPAEEELLREVARQVNHAYVRYKEIFDDKGSEEILAMVTLLFAKGFLQMKEQAHTMDKVLAELDASLTELLRS